MLVRLKLQAAPRFKLDGFEVSRDTQRGKDDMSVDVAPLGHEVDCLSGFERGTSPSVLMVCEGFEYEYPAPTWTTSSLPKSR